MICGFNPGEKSGKMSEIPEESGNFLEEKTMKTLLQDGHPGELKKVS